MTTKPGEVYKVDLGIKGKVRFMVVVSREDLNAPRALTLCVPITTSYRSSRYEIDIGKLRFLREKCYVNVQGLQAIQHHELRGPLGTLSNDKMKKIREALKYALCLRTLTCWLCLQTLKRPGPNFGEGDLRVSS